MRTQESDTQLADVELRLIRRDGCVLVSVIDSNCRDYLERCLEIVEGRIFADGSFLRHIVRTFYLKRLASRPLQRLRVKARQELSNSAPIVLIMRGKRTKHLFSAHPPIAPPQAA